jgi:predicted GNAT family N-acyltransferase
MFIAKWKMGLVEFEGVRAVREEVFVAEQGVPYDEEFDSFDGISFHLYITTEEGLPIAAARIHPEGDNTAIGRIAVIKQFRNAGYEEFALRMLLFKAQNLAGERITTLAPASGRELYERFGFRADGDTESIRNSECVRMSVGRDEITWFSQCRH